MTALPSDLNKIAKQHGVRKVARRTDLTEAFIRGEFSAETIGGYLTRQKEQRPHWFKEKKPGAEFNVWAPDLAPEKINRSNNPFARLRKPDGTVDEAAAAQVAKLTSALGTKKAAAIARSAGLTITGLPLRK